MNVLALVDELYEEFARAPGREFAEHARDLPRALRLAPMAGVPWSRVFSHEVTLGAPALFAEAMPDASPGVVRDAVRAHMLAVIHAFGTDRIEDGQILPSAGVLDVLRHARVERDRAVGRLCRGACDRDIDPSAADRATGEAIATERALLTSARAVDFLTYERVSLAKQSAGFVATLALTKAVGWGRRRRLAVGRTLGSVALALQMHDDVVDWEDDESRGGSWIVALVRGSAAVPPAGGPKGRGASLRSVVLGSGSMQRLLDRARQHMRAARLRAMALGARSLAAWAGGREARLAKLAAAESASAGYARRAHSLAAWATEVLR
jgi:hypothetical protein